MKLKTTIIASALLSLTALSAHAAQELTPEKAAALKPFDRITITGRFNAINEAVDAVSRRADKLGADSFYIRDSNNSNNGGNWRVTADLYHKDAPEVSKTPKYRVFNGVNELPKDEAYLLEPYDTVSVSGFYRSQPDINDAISKEAKKKVLHPSSSCARLTPTPAVTSSSPPTSIRPMRQNAACRARMPFRPILTPAAPRWPPVAPLPRKSKFGVASSGSPSRDVGRFFETQSSTGQRYTVTLPNGTKIQK